MKKKKNEMGENKKVDGVPLFPVLRTLPSCIIYLSLVDAVRNPPACKTRRARES